MTSGLEIVTRDKNKHEGSHKNSSSMQIINGSRTPPSPALPCPACFMAHGQREASSCSITPSLLPHSSLTLTHFHSSLTLSGVGGGNQPVRTLRKFLSVCSANPCPRLYLSTVYKHWYVCRRNVYLRWLYLEGNEQIFLTIRKKERE